MQIFKGTFFIIDKDVFKCKSSGRWGYQDQSPIFYLETFYHSFGRYVFIFTYLKFEIHGYFLEQNCRLPNDERIIKCYYFLFNLYPVCQLKERFVELG